MWKIRETKWRRLDNAAKIFPAIADNEDSEVFRIACELHEDIDKELLQRALDSAIEEFPTFTETIRRGVFWYYLENTGLRPKVHPENTTPLMPLYDDRNRLLIDISYYKNRINLEIFHALADGTGAFVFFKALVSFYLLYAHPDELRDVILEPDDSTERERESDGFSQYFESERGSSTNFEFLGNKTQKNEVYRFNERRSPDLRQHVTEGRVSAAAVISAAKSFGVTVTEFICSLLILSIRDTMEPRDKKKSVVVAIPVNLRNYFSSNTLRNFFGMVHISYDFSTKDEHEITDVAKSVKASFEREITCENMEQKIASQVKMERHPIVRVCPLFLKDFIMNILQNVSMKRRTICLSNVGRIKIQPEFEKYIDCFDVFNSSATRQICMCSFGDCMNISFSGAFAEHDVERAFFRRLAGYDENISVYANYSPKELE